MAKNPSRSTEAVETIGNMSADDHKRIRQILTSTAEAVGGNVTWGAASYLEVWITEHRMESERQASRRLEKATWALAFVTLVLALATLVLVYATFTQ